MTTHQAHIDNEPITGISQVATDVADVIKGYEVMTDRADASLKPIVQRLLVLHKSHAGALFEYLEKAGGKPEDAGSMMGAVHQTVAAARDWFDALDECAIAAVIDGEERLIESYSDALDRVSVDTEIGALLEQQRTALREHVNALQS